ncbi:hypothetical protein EDD66_10430 [Mobilisporobacter senegalensis]|uniref:Uncharacterized protein n=1 Tax=Mobilisporobacter senegalensis TaxID=1329262 RepID=A0A3N1XQB2_9FIRM|nr:hypothetical protein [Mobilisporobacter senegalensis]ROR28448.1 hypothetical protein EDD66_10430 [Mobilisporobacter senegalensis]
MNIIRMEGFFHHNEDKIISELFFTNKKDNKKNDNKKNNRQRGEDMEEDIKESYPILPYETDEINVYELDIRKLQKHYPQIL